MRSPLPFPFDEPRPEDLAAELAARDCLEECRIKAGLKRIPIPVPVEDWIEGELEIDYGFEELTDCVGYAMPQDRVIRIANMVAHDDCKVRWTAAHELGHVYIENPEETGIRLGDPLYSSLYDNASERQAERFAAAFLMPIEDLVDSLFKISSDHGLESFKTITSLMRRTSRTEDLWRRVFVPGMARHFNVAIPGVLFRLGELRLIDGPPLLLPRYLLALSSTM
ncbi:hypothetical protein LBMAG48_10490 [Phycisphaerae bacterium]|nr:hypothetical protein LBMAG48_10490 [Phycisphaerae bacterium]